MDQLICAYLSHSHFWYEVGMLKVPAYLSLELLVQKHCIITSLLLCWCPYMVINVSVQCNSGLLPDIILLTLCDSIGEPF